ncbi:protein FAR-RED IMPAIRED RESPONSE 1-like [Fagus crenata]
MDVSMGVLVHPNVSEEFTPSKGMEFESDEIACHFYNENGRKADRYRTLCPKYIQLVNEACETKEGYDILNSAIADLKRRLCDSKSCKGNVKEDNIRPLTNFVDKEDQLCASITIGRKGIKKKESTRNKKRRPKSWIEKIKKPKEGTSKKQTKEMGVSKGVKDDDGEE